MTMLMNSRLSYAGPVILKTKEQPVVGLVGASPVARGVAGLGRLTVRGAGGPGADAFACDQVGANWGIE